MDNAEQVEGETISGEDWYAAELTGRSYLRCAFVEVDLTGRIGPSPRIEHA